MYPRMLAKVLARFATLYPVVGITGPRQSGKTTLAKQQFPHLPYVSLEELDIRLRAEQDPRSFLAQYSDGAIFDEVQHVPTLLSYLQTLVDLDARVGRFVITGSQNFALSAQIAQSLSGRVGMSTLLPLSLAELGHIVTPDEAIFQGGYPRLHEKKMQAIDFYPSYVQTYIERDVRQFRQIEDLGRFQKFLKLCAARIGQLLNLSSLAQDAGISHTTARQWLTILEASYIVFTITPFYKNFSKRMIKMPKLYFYDTGLACSLLGLEKTSQVDNHYLKGGLFENLIILEILKARLNQGLPINLYFWRDKTGHEIDLIGEWGGGIHAIEIKSGATLHRDYVKNLLYFLSIAKDISPETIYVYLIYHGVETGQFLDVTLLPFKNLKDKLPWND